MTQEVENREKTHWNYARFSERNGEICRKISEDYKEWRANQQKQGEVGEEWW